MFFMFIFLYLSNKLLLKFQLKAACILLSHRFYRSEVWTGITASRSQLAIISVSYNWILIRGFNWKRFTSKILPLCWLNSFTWSWRTEGVLVFAGSHHPFETACNFFMSFSNMTTYIMMAFFFKASKERLAG